MCHSQLITDITESTLFRLEKFTWLGAKTDFNYVPGFFFSKFIVYQPLCGACLVLVSVGQNLAVFLLAHFRHCLAKDGLC